MVLVLLVLTALSHHRILRLQPIRGSVLLLLRLTSLLLITLLLLGPSVTPPSAKAPTRPPLTILLDTSASMSTPDMAAQTRLAFALEHWLPPDQLDSLRKNFNLRVVGFDQQTRSLTADQLTPALPATGPASNYTDALTSALLDLPAPSSITTTDDRPTPPDTGGAIVLLGDGHDSDNRSFAPALLLATDRSIPIHTVSFGSGSPPVDLAVVASARQDFLMINEAGQIAIQLHQVGFNDGQASVRITAPGVDEKRLVRFNNHAVAHLQIPIRHDQPGSYEYTIAVDPVPGERVTTNNQQIAFVEVTARRLRVLLLEGSAYWDTRFIAQSLRADPNLDLVQIIQLSEDRRQAISNRPNLPAVLPQTADELRAFDVVVLGSSLENLLSPAWVTMLDEYVWKHGGQVVMARGRAYDASLPRGQLVGVALAPVEPVVWGQGVMEQMPIRLTPSGRANPLLAPVVVGLSGSAGGGSGASDDADARLSRLPAMTVVQVVDRLKPAAIVLAEAGRPSVGIDSASTAKPPAIVTMNYGRGSVLAILGEGLWQWAMLDALAQGSPSSPAAAATAAAPPATALYQNFWSTAVRYMAMGASFQPGQQVALKLGRSSARTGQSITVELATRSPWPTAAPPTVQLISPTGAVQPITLTDRSQTHRRFESVITPDAVGLWRIVLPPSPLNDQPVERKLSVHDLDIERLQCAARPLVMQQIAQATGAMALDGSQPIDLTDRLQRRQAATIVPPKPRYIWDSPLLMAALLASMGIEWLLRRRAGWI
jgi:hypothetical protein